MVVLGSFWLICTVDTMSPTERKKIVLRQRCSKKLHFVTRNSINAHLKGLLFIISFRNRKNPFHHFESIKSSHLIWGCVLEDSWYRQCIWAKKSTKTAIFNSIMSGFDGLKTMKRIFYYRYFAIKRWNKTFRMQCFTASGDKIRLLEKLLKICYFWIFW